MVGWRSMAAHFLGIEQTTEECVGQREAGRLPSVYLGSRNTNFSLWLSYEENWKRILKILNLARQGIN